MCIRDRYETVATDPSCPLHTDVSLKKKVSKRGWEYVRCSEKNCPIWLPWDRHLSYVLSEVQNKMHPVLRQGFFYCFCLEPCKVGLTKRIESPNRGRCFLTCAQKNTQRAGCNFFQWIDEVWGPQNTDLRLYTHENRPIDPRALQRGDTPPSPLSHSPRRMTGSLSVYKNERANVSTINQPTDASWIRFVWSSTKKAFN